MLHFRMLLVALSANALTAAAPAPALDPERLAFNLKTTVESYETVGRTNAAWDAEAKQCLTAFARMRSTTNGVIQGFTEELKGVLPNLQRKRCEDPMIRYLALRFVVSDSQPLDEIASGYQEAARALQGSGYPFLRKFYAALWAYRATRNLDSRSSSLPSLLDTATTNLARALEDRSMPAREADEATETLLSLFPWSDPARWACYRTLEPVLTRYWSGAAFANLVKGQVHASHAWQARGNGTAKTVSESNWRLFAERLRIAEEALEAAWKLDSGDPRICLEMMRVELGQGKGLARLETWFQRGIRLDPASYDLFYAKIEYLRPRWYGSTREMIDFGRECTFNTNYLGSVRLGLADAHLEASRDIQGDEERQAYWRQKEVWPDVKVTFDQFFKLYPQETGYRHNYARYAYRCGQWQEFLDQVKLFPSTNHAYFGGLDQFHALVDHAEQHLKSK